MNLDRVRLDWPPDPAPPIVVGATGPKTLALAGEVADATVLSAGTTPEGIRAARGHIGAADHRVIVFVEAATGPGAEQRAREPGALAGDAAAVADGVRRFAEAGADTVLLQPTRDEPDMAGFLRFVAREVRPLVG